MRRSKAEAEATRHLILDAAEQLFANRGISSTRLEDVARQAGVTRGAIYWHFRNKHELLDAMIDRFVSPTEMAMDELLLRSREGQRDAVSVEQLKAVIMQSFRRVRGSPSAEQITRFMLRYSLCAETETLADKLEQERKASTSRLKRFVVRAQEEGVLRGDIPAQRLAIYIRAQIIGIFHQYLSAPCQYRSDAQFGESLDLLLIGLLPASAMSQPVRSARIGACTVAAENG